MSNERFDKQIRQKLQTPQPPPDSSRWNRFRGRLPVPSTAGWWTQYGGWVGGGLSAVGLVVALILLYQLHQRISQLEQENRSLQTTRPPATASVQPSVPIPATPSRTDTVYIVRKTIVEHRYLVSPNTDRFGVGENELTRRTPLGNVPPYRVASQVVPNDSARTRNTVNPLPESSPLPLTETPVMSSIEEKKVEVPAQPEAQKVAPVPSRPPFRLSSLRPRLGVESTVANHGMWSVGLSAEFFLKDNLSFSTGVQIAQQRAKNHQKLRGYNSDTGKNFEEIYRSHLPARYDQIDDIRIQTSAVRVPVNLNYYAPLRRNWLLAFSVGTVLDMSVYQTVQFESIYVGSEQFNSFEVNARNKVFHNLTFGTGLQYQRRRLSAQVTPFLLYDFRSTDYSATGGKLGLKGSVWLNL